MLPVFSNTVTETKTTSERKIKKKNKRLQRQAAYLVACTYVSLAPTAPPPRTIRAGKTRRDVASLPPQLLFKGAPSQSHSIESQQQQQQQLQQHAVSHTLSLSLFLTLSTQSKSRAQVSIFVSRCFHFYFIFVFFCFFLPYQTFVLSVIVRCLSSSFLCFFRFLVWVF